MTGEPGGAPGRGRRSAWAARLGLALALVGCTRGSPCVTFSTEAGTGPVVQLTLSDLGNWAQGIRTLRVRARLGAQAQDLWVDFPATAPGGGLVTQYALRYPACGALSLDVEVLDRDGCVLGFGAQSTTLDGTNRLAVPLTPVSPSRCAEQALLIGGPGVAQVTGLAAAPGGGAAVVGHFTGSALVSPGLALMSNGGQDAFVAVYDAGGALRWGRALGGAQIDNAKGVAFAPGGDVLVAGSFSGAARLCDGMTSVARGAQDIFLVRLSQQQGSCVFVETFGQQGQAFIGGLAVNDAGLVGLVGYFYGQLQFDSRVGLLSSRAASGPMTDAFYALRQLTPTGTDPMLPNFPWSGVVPVAAGQPEGAYQATAVALGAGPQGNMYLSGSGAGSTTQGWIRALTQAKQPLWEQSFGDAAQGLGTTSANDLVLAPDGGLYVAGSLAGSLVLYSGGVAQTPGCALRDVQDQTLQRALLLKLDSGGRCQWGWAMGASGTAANNSAWRVVLDGGRPTVAGYLLGSGDADFNLWKEAPPTDFDVLTAQAEADGTPRWARIFGGSSTDQAWGLGVDGLGQVWVAGQYVPPVDFRDHLSAPPAAGPAGSNMFLLQLLDQPTAD